MNNCCRYCLRCLRCWTCRQTIQNHGLRLVATPATHHRGIQAPVVPRERDSTVDAGSGGPAFDDPDASVDRRTRRSPSDRTLPSRRQLQTGVQHGWASKPHYGQIRIDPLTPAGAREMLNALIGSDGELETLKRRLVEKTERNPLFWGKIREGSSRPAPRSASQERTVSPN